ncbi:LuxR family maltose regulon positive regulatory protein [Pseudosporangium ferrugineum]|uniref:LuxR family maltose regulon positive regulatory protein n=1 Tax=Pseudosporangium ferrugineum TaxID=439699 RepID=A0A2T0SBP7_9ACTN|nr:LuxR family maltose regulon positive regulatory protein [Pseudosporangium ferrugineum]
MRADSSVAIPVIGQATIDDPLLRSRFEIPDRPPFRVSRPRLRDRLRLSNAPVTMVVGPPGSGKTQLVASWVADEPAAGAVAWITLEDDDRACPFWTVVVEALRHAGLDINPSLATSPVPAPADRSFLIRLAAELNRLRRPVTLVLDGVSDLTGTEWAAELEFVLRHTASLLRLVLIGRWDPPMPAHRYRLAGRLLEIRSADLAFTADEAAELLRLHGVQLSPAKLSSLLAHTEGWAAGLRLFAMALQGRQDADDLVDTITGNEATIAEYFFDEVLRAQPAHVRSFLLEVSVLDTFTADLAEAVTGRTDARGILAELERRNAFVQRAAEFSAVYRFHRLFAELLGAQLLCVAPERLRPLHARAATWFAEREQTAEAVGHAVKAADWDAAAAIVVEHRAIADVLLGGRTGRLGALLNGFPPDRGAPESALVAAALALADGSFEDCAEHLRRARTDSADGFGTGTALAFADILVRVMLADAHGTEEQVLGCRAEAQEALAHVPPDQPGRHRELTVLLMAAVGRAQSRRGSVDAAAVAFTRAVAQEASGCRYPRIQCLEHLAVIEAYRGRLRHAERLAGEAVELAGLAGLEPARRPVTAHVVLAWVAMERYDVDGAGHHLRVADQRHPHADPLTDAAFALVKSRRLQARGELRGAAKLLDDVDRRAAPRTPRWLAREVVLARARLMITMGLPDDGLRLIRSLPSDDVPGVLVLQAAALVATGDAEQAREVLVPLLSAAGMTPPVAVEGWLVMASVAAHDGAIEEARSALGQALRHAIPETQRRIVHQAWAQLRRLLRDDNELTEQYRILQGAARGAGGTGTPDTGPILIEPLSRREMEVLRGIAAMLPTEEIAARLFVSINTVKTHVRSILRKLSASRRNEAVRRARALGLI